MGVLIVKRSENETSGFDLTPFGKAMLGEQPNLSGEEDLALFGYSNFDPMEYIMGDWSWKPRRDAELGDKMVTYKPHRHPLAGIRF
jgi:hypothetical protein